MALYAFDGTWNKPDSKDDGKDQDTNVRKFLHYYAAGDSEANSDRSAFEEIYKSGVGTRAGILGRIVGGLTGAGGHIRVDECLGTFRELWRRNQGEDRTVDVIGFSRGAATALDFCNRLAKGVEIDGKRVRPEVRFLGLWDVVSAFGVPGLLIDAARKVDVGWDLDLPPNVAHCFHAMALDEGRQAFDAHRLDPEHDDENVEELWFRGVHSDVGGGNTNIDRSNISLCWMLQRAAACGLPVDLAEIDKLRASLVRDPKISHNTKQGEWLAREILPGDRFHPTAGRILQVGESQSVEVDARNRFGWSGIIAVKGGRYTFTPDRNGRWKDSEIVCDATGWPDDLIRGETLLKRIFGEAKEWLLERKVTGLLRRVKSANWFELCACIGTLDKAAFPVGHGQHATAGHARISQAMGPLFFFANDSKTTWKDFYENNSGSLKVTVTRVA
ncbi:MAG: DUF2235 domain-containing protein [Verrucomicrobiales bacterium]